MQIFGPTGPYARPAAPVSASPVHPVHAPTPAGQVISYRPTADQWLSFLASQRRSSVMAEHPIMRGESIEAYTRRINRIVAEKTTNAIREVGGLNASRPAGDAFSDMLNAYANGSTDGVTTPGSSSGSNSTPSIAPSLISGAAQVLGVAAQTITAIITSNNQTEIARVRAQAEERLIALQQQTNASRDSANQQQQEVLQQFIAAMNQRQSMSVGMMIAIGLGIAVVVGGGVYLLTSHHRRNPVLSIEGPDHKRHRNFVSMNKYKKMRARRAGK